MAGRVGFLPRGFKHLSPPDDDDVTDYSLGAELEAKDDDDAHSYFVTEHTTASVHDRFYRDDDEEFDYRPFPRFLSERKNR